MQKTYCSARSNIYYIVIKHHLKAGHRNYFDKLHLSRTVLLTLIQVLYNANVLHNQCLCMCVLTKIAYTNILTHDKTKKH